MRSLQHQEIRREFVDGEGTNVLVEGDEDGVLADGEAEQERIGDLAIAVQSGSKGTDEFEPSGSYGQMGDVWEGGDLLQKQYRDSHGLSTYRRSGHEAHEASLSNRAQKKTGGSY